VRFQRVFYFAPWNDRPLHLGSTQHPLVPSWFWPDLQQDVVWWLERHSVAAPAVPLCQRQLVTSLTPAQHAASVPTVCQAAVAAYVCWSQGGCDGTRPVAPGPVEACGALLLALLGCNLPGVPSTVHRAFVGHLRPRGGPSRAPASAGSGSGSGSGTGTGSSAGARSGPCTSAGSVGPCPKDAFRNPLWSERVVRLPASATTVSLLMALGSRVHALGRSVEEVNLATTPFGDPVRDAPSSDDADFAQPQSASAAAVCRSSVSLDASLDAPMDPLADALGACYVVLCSLPEDFQAEGQRAALVQALGTVVGDLVVTLTDGLVVARFLNLATTRAVGAGSGSGGASGAGGLPGTLCAPMTSSSVAPGLAVAGGALGGPTAVAQRAILPLYAFVASVFSDLCTASLCTGGVPREVLLRACHDRAGVVALFNRKHAMLTFRPMIGAGGSSRPPDASIVDPEVSNAVVLALLETMQLVAAVDRGPINAADVLRDGYAFGVTLAGCSTPQGALDPWAPLPLDVAESTLRAAVARVGGDGDHAGYPCMSSCRVLEAVLGCVVGEAYQAAAEVVGRAAAGWSRPCLGPKGSDSTPSASLHGTMVGAGAQAAVGSLARLSSLWHLVFTALRLHVELSAHMSPTVVLPCPSGLAARVLTVEFLAPFRVDVTTCLLQHLSPPAEEDRTVLVQALCLEALRAVTAAVNVASVACDAPVLPPQLLWHGLDRTLAPCCPRHGAGPGATLGVGLDASGSSLPAPPRLATFFGDRRDAPCHSLAVGTALAAQCAGDDFRALYLYIIKEGDTAAGLTGVTRVLAHEGTVAIGGGMQREGLGVGGPGLRPGDGFLSLTALWLATVLWRTLHSRMPAAVLAAVTSQVRWYLSAAVAWEGAPDEGSPVSGRQGPTLGLLSSLPLLKGSFAEAGLPRKGPLAHVMTRTVPGRVAVTLLEILKRFPLRASTVTAVLQALLLVPELRPRCALASCVLRALLGVPRTPATINPASDALGPVSTGPGIRAGAAPAVGAAVPNPWHLAIDLHFKFKSVGTVRAPVDVLEDALNATWSQVKACGLAPGASGARGDLLQLLHTCIQDIGAALQSTGWWEEEPPAQQPRFVACVCSLVSTVLAVVGGILQGAAHRLEGGSAPVAAAGALDVQDLGVAMQEAGIEGLALALGRLHSLKKHFPARAPITGAVAAFGRVVAATQGALAGLEQVCATQGGRGGLHVPPLLFSTWHPAPPPHPARIPCPVSPPEPCCATACFNRALGDRGSPL
jgi:hypothetical protein